MSERTPGEESERVRRVHAVVVAAGSSTRFGSDKLVSRLAGRTVLSHAVAAVRAALPESRLILVVPPHAVAAAAAGLGSQGVEVVGGGARRQDSVRNGVRALAAEADDVVVVHDGARPFVPVRDVVAVSLAAPRTGAACLIAPIADTVKRVETGGAIAGTVDRTGLARALTPQAFTVAALERAWAAAGQREWTDEAALIEATGGSVLAVNGDPRNIKVTRPEDLDALRGAFHAGTRVGQGVDVHAFASGRRLWLCGVEVPSDVGLLGHSDADAALHAVTDAILGACAAGDIGEHFPPSEERWRDAPSSHFVQHAVNLAAERGLRVTGCDVTILAERPRIGPYREAMRARLSELLGVAEARVNVKATTTERLGFVGRAEGITALAVVTLEEA